MAPRQISCKYTCRQCGAEFEHVYTEDIGAWWKELTIKAIGYAILGILQATLIWKWPEQERRAYEFHEKWVHEQHRRGHKGHYRIRREIVQ